MEYIKRIKVNYNCDSGQSTKEARAKSGRMSNDLDKFSNLSIVQIREMMCVFRSVSRNIFSSG